MNRISKSGCTNQHNHTDSLLLGSRGAGSGVGGCLQVVVIKTTSWIIYIAIKFNLQERWRTAVHRHKRPFQCVLNVFEIYHSNGENREISYATTYRVVSKKKRRGKAIALYAMKAYSGLSTAALNLGTRWRSAVNSTPRPLYRRDTTPASIIRRLGGPQQPDCKSWRGFEPWIVHPVT
jgi:hypothetical protein